VSTVDDWVGALLERPSVDALVYALRHREVWPAGFEWDYRLCTKCAMGLACKLWKEIKSPNSCSVESVLRMKSQDSLKVFYDMRLRFDGTITPEMVADELERVTASGPAP